VLSQNASVREMVTNPTVSHARLNAIENGNMGFPTRNTSEDWRCNTVFVPSVGGLNRKGFGEDRLIWLSIMTIKLARSDSCSAKPVIAFLGLCRMIRSA
jgi:hypothetical protein